MQSPTAERTVGLPSNGRAEKKGGFNPNQKLPQAALDALEERDRMFRKYEEEQRFKLSKLQDKYPALADFLDVLAKHDKTTELVEGGVLDTDFTDKAIALVRGLPIRARQAALSAFHDFIIKKNKQAGLSPFAAPLPWDEVSDLEVMKRVLRLR